MFSKNGVYFRYSVKKYEIEKQDREGAAFLFPGNRPGKGEVFLNCRQDLLNVIMCIQKIGNSEILTIMI